MVMVPFWLAPPAEVLMKVTPMLLKLGVMLEFGTVIAVQTKLAEVPLAKVMLRALPSVSQVPVPGVMAVPFLVPV